MGEYKFKAFLVSYTFGAVTLQLLYYICFLIETHFEETPFYSFSVFWYYGSCTKQPCYFCRT